MFLGSGQGTSKVNLVDTNYTFPTGVVGSTNVLTVVVDNMGESLLVLIEQGADVVYRVG